MVLFVAPRCPGFVPRLDVFLRVEVAGDLLPTPVLLGAVVAAGEQDGAGDKYDDG